MTNVYELAQEIPSYLHKKNGQIILISGHSELEEFISPTNQDDSLAEWVIQRQINGKLGEKIAKAYLQGQFSNVIQAKDDSYGYDILANDQCFEVKTSTSKQHFFIITENELETADQYKERYHIFYIMLNKAHVDAIGYIIDNPLSNFGITLTELLSPIETTEISFKVIAYKVMLGDYLEKVEKIELTAVCKYLKEQGQWK
jgi:hypothetical protein